MEGLVSIDLAGGTGDLHHERKLKQLGSEVARVAHELNTPVSLIAGSLSNLDQHVSALLRYVDISRAYTAEHPELARAYDEARMDYILSNSTNLLAICDEGVERLRYIAAQLRGYGRRDDSAGREEGVEIADILRCAERMARSTHPKAPLVEWNLQTSACVSSDEQTLLPALVNVIGNAFDAVVNTPAPRVRIAVESDQGAVVVRVIDNGSGVSEELRDKIFTPFFTTKRSGAGVGLGLAIARDSIEAAGGTIELGATADGAEFILRLPVL